MEWRFRRGNQDERERWKEKGGEKRGLRKSYLWFVGQTEPVWLLVRVSAAELALFHTGAILSSLGYRPPATATWEHLGGGESVCLVCVCGRWCMCTCKMCVCVCTAVVSDNTLTADLLSIPFCSPSASTTVQSARDLEANLLKCVSRNVPLCWDIFVFFNLFFLLQPLLNVIGACTAICRTIC